MKSVVIADKKQRNRSVNQSFKSSNSTEHQVRSKSSQIKHDDRLKKLQSKYGQRESDKRVSLTSLLGNNKEPRDPVT